MEQLGQLFSFSGRVRRMTFWINIVIFGVISFIVDQIFVDVELNMFTLEESYHISNRLVYYLISIVIIIRMLSITVRRWHDQDKGEIWLALAFFPVLTSLFPNLVFYSSVGLFLILAGSIASLVALGVLGFVPGDGGENVYGPPPPEGQWI